MDGYLIDAAAILQIGPSFYQEEEAPMVGYPFPAQKVEGMVVISPLGGSTAHELVGSPAIGTLAPAANWPACRCSPEVRQPPLVSR